MKPLKSAVLGTALSLLALGFSTPASAREFRGHWTIAPSKQAGMVMFGLTHRGEEGQSQHESDWPVRSLEGIDLATPGRHDVEFAVVREAGRLDAQGFVDAGEGAGTFRFTAAPGFVATMDGLGFRGIDQQKQFAMAVHDVTSGFARALKAKDLDGLDTDKLIAFRIFEVTPAFIDELRAAGLPARDATELVAFRVHEVTPAYVAKVRAANLGEPEGRQLIAMRVHGITPEYIAQMKARGLKNLTLDRLVQLKVHGID